MAVARTFTELAKAEAFIQNGDPNAGFGPVPQRWEPADPGQISWELIPCDLALQPWVCSLNRAPDLRRPTLDDERLFSQSLRTVLGYYLSICDAALAFDWHGNRVEGTLTGDLVQSLCNGEWFGLQLYKGERTLFHLDDGSDNYFVVDEPAFAALAALGVQDWQLRPEYAGPTLHRAGPDWTGG